MKSTSIILATIVLFLSSLSASGAFLRNVPQTLEQPDGTTLNCLATGDEFHNWLHDENNFTIIQHPQTGFYVYAEIRKGKLEAGDWVAGTVDPAGKGLEPGLNISREEYLEKQRMKTKFPGYKSQKATSNIGTMENLVVFIRFQDQNEYTERSSYYDNAFNGTNMVSMNSYYDVVSEEQLEINSHIFPSNSSATVVSYQDSHSRNYFQPYNVVSNPAGYRNDNEFASREHTLLKNATESVQAEIEGKNLDLDMDNDGNVDNIVYVIQGKTDGWSDLLWPHKWALYSYNLYLNGAKIWWYNFQLSEAFNVSVLCHEMFHSLGAPDLYRYEDRNLTPVGPWDVMAETTTPPQHMSVYMKQKYGGWISSIPSITASGTYSLEPLSSNPYAAYKIASPNSTSEYFILEYRRKTGQFESSLPGSGLVIYRINPSIDGNAEGPPDEIYTFRPNGTRTNNGDIYKAFFSSQSSNTRFDDTSNPSCFLGNGTPGGIQIQNIGPAGTTISFDVVMGQSLKPPRNLTASVDGNTVRLNWQKPQSGNGSLTGYKVFRDGNQITTITNPSALSYSDTGLGNGQYDYFIKASYTSPSGESPGSNVATVTVGTTGQADLHITDAVVDPLIIEANSEFSVSCKLVNRGTLQAGGSMLRLFLSKDQQYDSGDISLAYGSMDAIGSGKYLNITGDGLTMPESAGSGSWWVIFIADADDHVPESNENNNISSVRISIPSEGFDPPTNFQGIVSGNSAVLSWDAPVNGSLSISGYNVYRNYQLVKMIDDPELLEYTDSGLSVGSYTYFVTAVFTSPSGESERSNSLTLIISTVDRPDLIVRNPQVIPEVVYPGDKVSISCELVNNGDDRAGGSMLRLFFSRDEFWDDQDIEMAYGDMDELDAGYYFPISGDDISIPADLLQGVWQVLFIADADKEVIESIETNNIAVFQITVGSTNFNPPRNLNASVSGSNVILNWQAPQQGTGTISSYGIYRNGIKIYQINDPSASSYSDIGLDQGSYTYFVTAVYVSPAGESSSSNSVSVEITNSVHPDLVITDASVNPVQIEPGGLISVSCKLRNLGFSVAGESIIRLYISRNETVEAQDEEIASGTMDQIDPGGYIEVSGEGLELPSSITNGLWYLIFVADADKGIQESDEQNNSTALAVGIGESIFDPPENLHGMVSGNAIELNWDPPKSGSSKLTGYNMYRNGTFYASIGITDNQGFIDSNLAYESYSYVVTAEYKNPTGESIPSNEIVITISSELKPDLTIQNPVVFPTFLDPGGVVSISCNLLNIGNAQAGYSYLRLYLSENDELDDSDHLLAYGSIDPMSPGANYSISGEDLYIPENLTPGDWFVFFVADADKEIGESNEYNNQVAFSIGVTNKKPDLIPTSLYLIREYANPGDMMRLTLFIDNNGQGQTEPSITSFYLSNDQYLDDQDIYLNNVRIGEMSGGEQIFKNNYITIPPQTIRRQYYLIANVDANQDVVETDENNNTLAKRITVGSSGVETEEWSEVFSIYPVPASKEVFFHFEGHDQGLATICIYDQLGRKMFFDQIKLLDYQTKMIDISTWQKGFYYARIISGEKQYVSTFIKL